MWLNHSTTQHTMYTNVCPDVLYESLSTTESCSLFICGWRFNCEGVRNGDPYKLYGLCHALGGGGECMCTDFPGCIQLIYLAWCAVWWHIQTEPCGHF